MANISNGDGDDIRKRESSHVSIPGIRRYYIQIFVLYLQGYLLRGPGQNLLNQLL